MKYTKEYLRDNKIAIKCDNAQEAWTICFLLKGQTNYDNRKTYFGINDNEDDLAFYEEGVVVAYGETVIQASEVIAYYEASKQNHKLLGYKAPFDMFEKGNEFLVNKGDLYVKKKEQDNGYYHDKLFCECDMNNCRILYLPAEIVEQWDPVYEEEKPTFGSFSDIIKHFKGASVFIDGYIKIDDKNPDVDFIYIENDKFNLTDSFKKELTELGIKF